MLQCEVSETSEGGRRGYPLLKEDAHQYDGHHSRLLTRSRISEDAAAVGVVHLWGDRRRFSANWWTSWSSRDLVLLLELLQELPTVGGIAVAETDLTSWSLATRAKPREVWRRC